METHAVSYTPSGAVLTLERTRAPEDREQLLAVGGVSYNKDAPPRWRGLIPWPLFRGLDSLRRDQLHELPGTVDEVRMVRGTLNELKPVVLSGTEATELNFKREAAREFDVVHLAVHAFATRSSPTGRRSCLRRTRNRVRTGFCRCVRSVSCRCATQAS